MLLAAVNSLPACAAPFLISCSFFLVVKTNNGMRDVISCVLNHH